MTNSSHDNYLHPDGFRDVLHSLSQPLTAINNYSHAGKALLSAGHPDKEQLQEIFDKIAAQSARSLELSRELRSFINSPSTRA